jgi:CDP-diacylglycerol--glycerol-3-phosphate 3-phosphatidyltransferase
MKQSKINLANILTSCRIFLTPILFIPAIQDDLRKFLFFYSIIGATDFADGLAARALKQTSKFGSWLDSVADIVFFFATIALYYIMRPELLEAFLPFVALAIIFYVIYFLYPLCKFRKFLPMHTQALRTFAVFACFAMISGTVAYYRPPITLIVASVILLATLAISIFGFAESILIFREFEFEEIDVNVRKISEMPKRRRPPPA